MKLFHAYILNEDYDRNIHFLFGFYVNYLLCFQNKPNKKNTHMKLSNDK